MDGYKETLMTDKEVIREIYNVIKVLNPNVKLSDFSRNPFRKEYIGNFQNREGWACCMFADRFWLCDHFHTSKVWFTKDGIKVYTKIKD